MRYDDDEVWKVTIAVFSKRSWKKRRQEKVQNSEQLSEAAKATTAAATAFYTHNSTSEDVVMQKIKEMQGLYTMKREIEEDLKQKKSMIDIVSNQIQIVSKFIENTQSRNP